MRSWAAAKALAKQRQVRRWKKHHLRRTGSGQATTNLANQPVFMATTNGQQRTQELDDFLSRLRDRR